MGPARGGRRVRKGGVGGNGVRANGGRGGAGGKGSLSGAAIWNEQNGWDLAPIYTGFGAGWAWEEGCEGETSTSGLPLTQAAREGSWHVRCEMHFFWPIDAEARDHSMHRSRRSKSFFHGSLTFMLLRNS